MELSLIYGVIYVNLCLVWDLFVLQKLNNRITVCLIFSPLELGSILSDDVIICILRLRAIVV